MTTVGMHEAKTNLSKLVAEVEAGGEVVIARHGRPVARLVRVVEPADRRGYGAMSDRSAARPTWADVEAGDRAVAEMFGTD